MGVNAGPRAPFTRAMLARVRWGNLARLGALLAAVPLALVLLRGAPERAVAPPPAPPPAKRVPPALAPAPRPRHAHPERTERNRRPRPRRPAPRRPAEPMPQRPPAKTRPVPRAAPAPAGG